MKPVFHVIIPARMASTRLPGKMLADLGGVPLVVRTAQQALKSAAASVTIAADDALIMQAAAAHGIPAVLTDVAHATGTDRLAQAARLLQLPYGLANDALIVNVQGDEPLIAPELINAVAVVLAGNVGCALSTAAHAIHTEAEARNPNIVKVVCNAAGEALYFSRAPIPYARVALTDTTVQSAHASFSALRHIGIYGYRNTFLQAFAGMTQAPIEIAESLEQLRALWHGHKIAVANWAGEVAAGVDTAEDLAVVRRYFN